MISFSIGPCRVTVHFSCIALLAFCCIFTGMAGGAACFWAVLIHELAHLAVMWALRVPPEFVSLSALGCRVVQRRNCPASMGKEAAISLAGPGANWITYLLLLWLGMEGTPFAGANLALGLAHSLPIEPLDGGLALRYLLCGRLGADLAGRISRVLSAILLFPLAAFGFFLLLNTRYNYSLLVLSVYIMFYLLTDRDYAAP